MRILLPFFKFKNLLLRHQPRREQMKITKYVNAQTQFSFDSAKTAVTALFFNIQTKVVKV